MTLTTAVRAEIGNIITHAVGIVLALAALITGLVTVYGSAYTAAARASVWVYGLCMVALYTASAVYHSVFRRPSWQRVCRRFDHAAIYLMIAGTYTPFLWIALSDTAGIRWSALIWGIAAVGVTLKLAMAARFHLLSVLCYLGMGWLALWLLPDLWRTVPAAGIAWLVIGGLCYSVGCLFYIAKQHPFAHVVWHCFVLAGSAAQWCSVQFYVLPQGAL